MNGEFQAPTGFHGSDENVRGINLAGPIGKADFRETGDPMWELWWARFNAASLAACSEIIVFLFENLEQLRGQTIKEFYSPAFWISA